MESTLTICKQLLDIWSNCSYGIPVNDEIIPIMSAKYFNKHYKLLSPKQFIEYNGGICWDYVEFGDWFLTNNNIKFHKYYISTSTEDNDTHTFILVEYDNKYLYIESSFKLLEGIYAVDNVQEVIELITNKMFWLNNNYLKYKTIKYYVWEYVGHPPYGSGCVECTEYFSQGGPIYENIAINEVVTDISLIKATPVDVSSIYKWTMDTIPKKWWNDDTYRLIKRDAWESIHKTRMIYLENTENIAPKEPIGMITAYNYTYNDKPDWWYIAEIYLIEDYRGLGIGKAVLENEIINHNKLLLQVDKNNTHAIELYKSLGFEITEDDENRYIMKLFTEIDENLTEKEKVDIMKLHIKETNTDSTYTEKQLHLSINDLFYKYFPDGECWVKTVGGSRRVVTVHCFAEENDDNDFYNNIDCLDVELIISSGTVSTISFPVTPQSNIKAEANSSYIKLPNGSREQVPFKTIYGNPDKILRAINRYFKLLKTTYDANIKECLKSHIKESITGRIEDTNERCVMKPNGYWVGRNGRHITSYERVDKDIEYDKNGNPVKRQYSMDRQHRFWIETEDKLKEY